MDETNLYYQDRKPKRLSLQKLKKNSHVQLNSRDELFLNHDVSRLKGWTG